ncbi:MAG: nuclease, partial [Acidobacteria bacterium]
DFGGRTYSILVDGGGAPTVDASGALTRTDAPNPLPDEVTIASANLQRFFDTVADPHTSDPVLTPAAFESRLNKVSRLIRDVLKSPDIVGAEEVENLVVLQAIAARVNADALAAGGPDPGYTAYLEEGNDVGGIDVGFLVKTSRVTVESVLQYGHDETYIDPATGLPFMVNCSPNPDPCPDNLNDRPPLVLKGSVAHPSGSSDFAVTVIVNHLRSLSGIDGDDGYRIRHKRRAQAEFLASLVQSLQSADPDARIVSVGDYNAFQFSDGYVDGIGTIKGTPAPADEVVVASPDLLDPDLTNLTDGAPAAERYSYVFSGSAQELDHVLVNPPALASFTRLGHPRVNADFPEVLRNDPDSPVRSSDPGPVVAYFRFRADLSIAISASPDPVPTGSAITYAVMVANAGPDAADEVVVSDTLPAGTTFQSVKAPPGWSCTTPPPGGTGALSCHAASLARGTAATLTLVVNVGCSLANGTAIANTATVRSGIGDPDPGNDAATATVAAANPPPTLACPAPIAVDAPDSSGAAVAYPLAVASDNCPGVSVVCLPPSGATFPMGITTVGCTGTDSGGSSATCAFPITVNTPRAIKQDVLGDLVALRATATDRSDREKLEAAIKHLVKSVDPSLWLDDSHPQDEDGGRVFGEEQEAVGEL